MPKFIKDGGVKALDKDSKLIPIILKDGWVELKAEAKKAQAKKDSK